jgi:redox-sensitive bicupin YhaK (pirin superfamily)
MIRKIDKIRKSRPTMEGAGVHLNRVFGYHEVPLLDPFLLLDDFHSDNPNDYIAGFPWHPHRGIETVTYMIEGKVEHGDSIGNAGTIESGDCQWMTAGSGIIHQEMPKKMEGMMWGFQLWVNLPKSQKMMKPRYQEIKANTVPEVMLGDGIKVRVVSGDVGGVKGPVTDIVVDPEYLDVYMPPNTDFIRGFKPGYKVFAYLFMGDGTFESNSNKTVQKDHLVIFTDGDEVMIKAGEEGARFLLISGKPLNEPVAWYGPIVMNTQEELDKAFREYREGTFIKDK